MNAKKCCFTIFSGGNGDRLDFDLLLNGESIPYNQNPIFLGITFDEKLCFNTHFENLRIRALKRLNILKIFSHKSWHINRKTLTNIYNLPASFPSVDYSFFSVAYVSDTSLGLREFKTEPFDASRGSSGVVFLKKRFFQLGAKNPFLCQLAQ